MHSTFLLDSSCHQYQSRCLSTNPSIPPARNGIEGAVWKLDRTRESRTAVRSRGQPACSNWSFSLLPKEYTTHGFEVDLAATSSNPHIHLPPSCISRTEIAFRSENGQEMVGEIRATADGFRSVIALNFFLSSWIAESRYAVCSFDLAMDPLTSMSHVTETRGLACAATVLGDGKLISHREGSELPLRPK